MSDDPLEDLARAARGEDPRCETVHFSSAMDGRELGELANQAIRNGYFGLHALLTALRFISDGNRIKNPYSKAERYCLAWQACLRAFEYEDSHEMASGPYRQLESGIDAVIVQCVDTVHQKYHDQLMRSKSHDRQWKISQKAADEMAKFRDLHIYFTDERGWHAHALSQLDYWETQLKLLS